MKHVRLVALLAAGALAVLYVQWSPHGPALAVRVECPARVRLGQEAMLRILIGNPHRHPVRLEDIDVSQSYVNGLMAVKVTPAARESLIHDRLGVLTLSYDEPLPSYALREWIVRLKAVRPGPFVGEVAVYSGTNVTSRRVATMVVP